MFKINLSRIENKIIIEIEDNGVGRKSENMKMKSSSKATGIILDKLKNLNKLYPGANFLLEYIDLKTEQNQPIGTKIVLSYNEVFD